jgi:DnaK suppressor protein
MRSAKPEINFTSTPRPPCYLEVGESEKGKDGSMDKGLRRELEEKRDKLTAEMARLSAPPKETGGISFGKRVGEGTSMAVDRLQEVAAHDKAQTVLAEATRALEKLDEGTYGKCDDCGRDIAPERLNALPWATHCVRCASKKR